LRKIPDVHVDWNFLNGPWDGPFEWTFVVSENTMALTPVLITSCPKRREMGSSHMHGELKLVVDGVIYQKQSHGGISRLYSEILPRMCDIDASLHITLFTDGPLKQSLPQHPRITPQVAPSVKRPVRVRAPLWNLAILPIRRLGSKLWSYARSLWIGRGKGAIWHSTYYTLPKFWDGFQVVTVYDTIHERFPDLYNGSLDDLARQQKRRCIQGADAVICISETTRQEVQRFFGLDPDSIYVIPVACSNVFRRLDQSDDATHLPTTEPFLLYVGIRAPYKNFEGLIHAYSTWSRRREVALVVVGGAWSADERQRLAKLGIQEHVHLLTGVDDEALCRLYNQATAFVYPSLYEGFGIPLLEAMACGCPIVASRIPSTIEVAGECPTYFEPDDMESLLPAFDRAMSEGRDSDRVRVGLKHVKDYSWDETARQTLEVYHALSNPE